VEEIDTKDSRELNEQKGAQPDFETAFLQVVAQGFE
jgi:hypothetical protein